MTTWVPRLPANSRLAAERVLACDAALLVRGGAERQVGLAEEAVVGDDAVAGGEDVGKVGAHLAVDDDRVLDVRVQRRLRGELAVGSHADDDEDDVGGIADRLGFRGCVPRRRGVRRRSGRRG